MNTIRTKPLPALTGRFRCERLGKVADGCPPLIVHRPALDAALEISDQSPEVEVGGFLLGNFYRDTHLDQTFIEATDYVQATQINSQYRSLTFTHDSWAALHKQMNEKFPERQIVGWHHTHPGFGIFLSRQDRFIHRNFFSQPWHVALVVDPRRGELGFFQWQEDRIRDTGFLLVDSPK